MRLAEREFDALVMAHRARWFRFALSLARNRQDAEDLLSVSMLAVWQSYDAQKGTAFNTFAYLVTRRKWGHMVQDRNRLKRRGVVVSLDAFPKIAADLAAPQDVYFERDLMTGRYCCVCREVKRPEEFGAKPSTCLECKRAANLDYYRRKKEQSASS